MQRIARGATRLGYPWHDADPMVSGVAQITAAVEANGTSTIRGLPVFVSQYDRCVGYWHRLRFSSKFTPQQASLVEAL